MTNDDDLKTIGATGRARVLPSPSVGRGEPLLRIHEDAQLHQEALVVMRERRQLDDATAISQSLYDDALVEARRRRSRGGKPHARNDDDPIRAVREKYATDDADIDEASALAT